MNGLWDALEERDIYPQAIAVSEEPGRSTSAPQGESAEGQSQEEAQKSEPDKSIHESDADIKVEVEDTVVYVDIKNPQDDKQALITCEKSNPEWGAININTPIAKALIGATLDTTVEAKLPRGTVSLRIKNINKPAG